MSTSDGGTNRREFLAAGGVGAALLLAAGESRADDSATSAAEQANEKVVNEFCATWETMDIDKLMSFLDDKIVFRMIDNMPFVEGKQAMIDGIGQFLAPRTSARFEMLRSVAVGNIVVNERIDHFGKEEGPEDAFHITGVFLVKKGKIVEWRDYMMPAG